jgi:CRP/FNR family cyclic AMP-dependent transcriptional regulator
VEQIWWPRTRSGDLVPFLSDHEERRLLGLMEPCTARSGDVILHKGSPSRSLLLVEEGRVEVLDDAMGQALVLGRVGAGGVIGEVGFVDGQPRTHHVRAVVDCRLRRLTRDGLLRLAKGDAELFAKLTIALAQLVARRYRAAMDELAPVRAFAASLREPMSADPPPGDLDRFSEIDAPLPSDETVGRLPGTAGAPGPEAAHALDLIRDVARRALEGREAAGV